MNRRRCLPLLLALALVIALPASAEGTDPIVGCWYIDMEMADSPAVSAAENVTRSIVVAAFEPDGRISVFEVDYTGNELKYVYGSVMGEWEKTETGYQTKIIGVGVYGAELSPDQNELTAVLIVQDAAFVFRRMTRFDWYADLSRPPMTQ